MVEETLKEEFMEKSPSKRLRGENRMIVHNLTLIFRQKKYNRINWIIVILMIIFAVVV